MARTGPFPKVISRNLTRQRAQTTHTCHRRGYVGRLAVHYLHPDLHTFNSHRVRLFHLAATITAEHLKTAAGFALDGNFTGAERELTSAGQLASDAAKRVITDGDRLIPISDMTKANRRAQGLPGDKPLYAHGYLLRSITYVVRGKK